MIDQNTINFIAGEFENINLKPNAEYKPNIVLFNNGTKTKNIAITYEQAKKIEAILKGTK